VAFIFRATKAARRVHSSSSSSSFRHFACVSRCFLREVLCSRVAFTGLWLNCSYWKLEQSKRTEQHEEEEEQGVKDSRAGCRASKEVQGKPGVCVWRNLERGRDHRFTGRHALCTRRRVSAHGQHMAGTPRTPANRESPGPTRWPALQVKWLDFSLKKENNNNNNNNLEYILK
jgi:hypothetical protein